MRCIYRTTQHAIYHDTHADEYYVYGVTRDPYVVPSLSMAYALVSA